MSQSFSGAISFTDNQITNGLCQELGVDNELNCVITFQPGECSLLSIDVANKEEIPKFLSDWITKSFGADFGSIVSNLYVHEADVRREIRLEHSTVKGLTVKRDEDVILTLTIDGILLLEEPNAVQDSFFYLSENVFKLIENFHINKQTDEPGSPFVYETSLTSRFPIEFTGVKVFLEHNTFVSNKANEREVTIVKQPRIRVVSEGRCFDELILVAHALTLLISLYLSAEVKLSFCKIRGVDYTASVYWEKDSRLSKDEVGKFSSFFNNDFIGYIKGFDSSRVVEHIPFLSYIIPRLNLGMQTRGETRFMMLYNVLEFIRNKWIEESSIFSNWKKAQRFEGEAGKERTDKELRNHLRAFAPFISELDRAEYLESIDKGNGSDILYKPMFSQFNEFCEHLNVSADGFGLNFIDLLKYRNRIFHGSLESIQSKEIDEINKLQKLPSFAFVVLLSFIGYKELPTFK